MTTPGGQGLADRPVRKAPAAKRPLPLRKPPAGPGRLPNLLVIGAQKAGTTWLHRRLAVHPQILMSKKKEMNLFADPGYEARLDEYRAAFPETAGKLFYGESTPGYFWTHDPDSAWCARFSLGNRDIPASVLRTLGPDTRLVLSLRHPVERAVSALFHHFRRGRTKPGDRLAKLGAWHGIVDMGFYARHWRAWTRLFGEAAPIVIVFDSIESDPAGVMRHITDRLGLAAGPQAEPEAEHVGFRLRIRDEVLEIDPDHRHNRALAERWAVDLAAAPRVHAEDVAMLDGVFREDIAFCQERWVAAAGVDWTVPRRLEDLLSGR